MDWDDFGLVVLSRSDTGGGGECVPQGTRVLCDWRGTRGPTDRILPAESAEGLCHI